MDLKFPESGYLFIASGENFAKEAVISANSLKKINPKAHITLITDFLIEDEIFNFIKIKKSENGKFFKVENIFFESPYKYTIFVDTDTYFCEKCDELFDLLKYFDILMAPSPADKSVVEKNGENLKGVSLYNSGVIIFKKSLSCMNFFSKWKKIYKEKMISRKGDQPALVEAIIDSNVKIGLLSNIYNARFNYYLSINHGFVKILHGRTKDFKKILLEINKNNLPRNWHPEKQKIIN